jgi:hypothetical protein
MSLPRIRIRIGKAPDGIEIGAKEAGQVIVIFVLMLTVLIGVVGIAIDVTYAWRSGLQVQRAADAAAMAGVVYLPGDQTDGTAKAISVAKINGYATGVVAGPNHDDSRKMNVTITAQVPTFFVRLFGINSWTVSRSAEAAYIMPVPMGSPLAYMGVGCLVLSGQTAPTCNTPATSTGASGVTTAGTSGGTSLNSLGAWGAIITRGGDEQNGDAFAPANNLSSSPKVNVLYPSSTASPAGEDGYQGYFYTVVLPAAGGSIEIFDPGFCENKANGNTYYGTGDHWIGGSPNGVSTYYTLWNTGNVPLEPGSWTKTGDTDGGLFVDEKGTDGGASGSGPCDAYHNKWWTLASSLPAGTYEVQVSTTNPNDATVNASTNAENMFAIMAVGGGSPTVYGYQNMCVYNNLVGGSQQSVQRFYLAKVDQITGAGKTLTIDLFDIGDSTAGSIQILSPDAGTPNPSGPVQVTNFSYYTYNYDSNLNQQTSTSKGNNCKGGTSDACSDTGRSSITVSGTSGSSFNNTWIEITISLPDNYGGANGIDLWQGGWWQVQYNVTGGNDTTTWSVNVNGNPVHLVPVG